jgi:hypothetical protein
MVVQDSVKSTTAGSEGPLRDGSSDSALNHAHYGPQLTGERIGPKQQALIFVHIPKTAGSTLNSIIVREYGPFQIAAVDGRYWRWAYRRMTHWTPQRFNPNDIFTGHMPFGLHKLMSREATYMTVLRKPVERVISEYFYRINRKSHPVEDREIKNLSLREYVEKLPYDNVQTKLLAGGTPDYNFMAGTCSSAMLGTAKRNLTESFSLVGLTERFEETLALCRIIFGWKVNRYAVQRVTRGKPNEKAISADLRELIAERNRFDMELYQYGAQLFEQILGEHRGCIPQMLEEVRKARLPQGPKTRIYSIISYLRKVSVRARSDL